MQTHFSATYPGRANGLFGNGTGTGALPGSRRDEHATVRARVEELARKQETLSHEKEGLLVERSKVRASADAVRKQRIATGDAEVQFMNDLREFYEKNKDTLPQHLAVGYEKVVEERDTLGSIEEGYLQAERTLGGNEWVFVQRERVFYQYELQAVCADDDHDPTHHEIQAEIVVSPPPPPPPPSPLPPGQNIIIVHGAPPPPPPPPPPSSLPPPPLPQLPSTKTAIPIVEDTLSSPGCWATLASSDTVHQQYQTALSDLDSLRREFNSLRSQQSELLDISPRKSIKCPDATRDLPGSSKFFDRYSELLDRITECEVRVQHLKQESMQYERITLLSRRMSDPIPVDQRASSPFANITRAQTDGMLHNALENPKMKLRIREWLLDYVKNNPVERKTYFNMLEAVGIPVSDINSLEDCAGQYWPLESTDESPASVDEPQSPADFDGQDLIPSPLTPSQQKFPNAIQTKAQSTYNVRPTASPELDDFNLSPLSTPLAKEILDSSNGHSLKMGRNEPNITATRELEHRVSEALLEPLDSAILSPSTLSMARRHYHRSDARPEHYRCSPHDVTEGLASSVPSECESPTKVSPMDNEENGLIHTKSSEIVKGDASPPCVPIQPESKQSLEGCPALRPSSRPSVRPKIRPLSEGPDRMPPKEDVLLRCPYLSHRRSISTSFFLRNNMSTQPQEHALQLESALAAI